MKKFLPWLLLLVFAGYAYWAVNYWHCYKCQCCAGAPPPVAIQSSGIPNFLWNADRPEPDSNFLNWKKALLAKGGQGDTLFITGLFRAEETAKSKKLDLGLARANFLASLMPPEIPVSRIKTASKLVKDSLTATSKAMESVEFSWRKMVLKKEEGAIIESDNDVTFLFPFNSTEKDHDPKVDDYLKNLVEKHKTTTNTFIIVGHTDDVGEPPKNVALGLGRANSIKNMLVKFGIAADRIKTDSKGEAEPLADNSTEDGRHQNRRVVLTVSK